MKKNLLVFLNLLILFCGSGISGWGMSKAYAQKEASANAGVDNSRDNLFYRLKDDVEYMLKKPFHMEAKDWLNFGLLSSVVGVASVYDNWVKEAAQKNQNDNFDSFEILGNAAVDLGIFAGFYGLHKLSADKKHRETAFLGIEALATSGALTSLLKYSLGRERPDKGDNWFSGGNSFPSGHTTSVFATARILDYQYFGINEEDAVPAKFLKYMAKAGLYSLASSVGLERIYNNKHHLSDVVAGVIIGTISANMVINLNKEDPRGWKLKPATQPLGLSLNKDF